MDTLTRTYNEQHKLLRAKLRKPVHTSDYLDLFLEQHSFVHSAEVSGQTQPTREDEIWDGLSDTAARAIPEGGEHSIIWCVYHLARIEDVSMSILLAETDPLLDTAGLHTNFITVGNEMTPVDILELSQSVDVAGLRAYRDAVAIRTRKFAADLQPADLRRKPRPERIQMLFDKGILVEKSKGVADYWGGLTLAGLLLMPPTRHNLIHLNECVKIKKKVLRFPA